MQSSSSRSSGGVRRLSSASRRPHQPAGPSVTRRLLYGAVALVLASVVTPLVCLLIALGDRPSVRPLVRPLVCLAAGVARTRLARCVERRRGRRRRRFDKSGEYERVDSVSSVVDIPPSHGTSQQMIDGPVHSADGRRRSAEWDLEALLSSSTRSSLLGS